MPNPTDQLQQELEQTVSSAPELQHSPHTAATVAQSGGDLEARAQVVAQAQRQAGVHEGLLTQVPHADSIGSAESGALHETEKVGGAIAHGLGWLVGKVAGSVHEAAHLTNEGIKRGMGAVGLGGVYRDVAARTQAGVGSVVSPAVSAGLHEYQHQYRYLHDIEARHGFLAALSQGVTDTAGFLAGSALAGPSGGVMGAELVGGVQARLLYQDSWDRTADGTAYRDPNTGRVVSFGRDLAGLLGLKPGSGHYSDVSGVLDAIGSLVADPLQQAGRIYAGAKGMEGAKGLLGQAYRGYGFNTDTLNYAWNNPGLYQDYHRMLGEIVAANQRGEPGAIGLLDRRLAPIVGDVHYAAEQAPPGWQDVFRWDAAGSPAHRAAHVKGAYYSVGDMSVADGSPYRVRGNKYTQLFYNPQDSLEVGANMSRGASLGHSAATAALDSLYDGGYEAFLRASQDPAQLAQMKTWLAKRGVSVPANVTTEELAARYAPALARSQGYKSIVFNRGNSQELLALDPSILRAPNAARTAKGLGTAMTPEEAHNVLLGFTKSKEYLSGRLPTMSSLRLPFNRLRSDAANMDTDFVDRVSQRFGRLAGMAVGLGSPRKWADRFQHIPGMEMDPEKLTFNGKAVDFTQPGLPMDVMDMVRFSQNEGVAVRLGTDWVNADPAHRITIFRNAVLDTVFGAMGVKLRAGEHAVDQYLSTLDPQSQKYLGEWLDNHSSVHSPDGGGVYGHTLSGTKTPNVFDVDTERELGAGIRLAQRGMGAIPSFTEVKRMGMAIQGARDIFGTLDDAAYHYVTQDFFKPLVLQSIAYAEHIALAEDIPNLLRLGPRNFLSSALASVKTRLGHTVDARPDTLVQQKEYRTLLAQARKRDRAPGRKSMLMSQETEQRMANAADTTVARFQGFVNTMLGKVPMDSWKLDRMAEIYSFHGDEGVPPIVLAGHNYGPMENQAEKVVRGLRSRAESNTTFREGKQFTMEDPSDRRFLRNWKIQLRGVLNDPIESQALATYATRVRAGASEAEATRAAERSALTGLQGLPDETRAFYLRSQHSAVGHDGVDPLQSWASLLVEDMKALTHSPETRKPHDFLLNDMANGRTPGIPTLKAISDVDKPRKIAGRVLVPEGTGRIQRIANVGFRRVLNPMVDELSRHPMFGVEYMQQYRVLEPMIQSGLVREDEAVTIAMSRAARESMRFVHNLHDRTQWSETMRNWAPFYFAQEQAYRRMGRLLVDNPGAFRQYQLMISNVHDLTQQQQDAEGNTYFALPGAGFLDRGTVGVFGKVLPIASVNPVEFGGSWSATNVMFPLSQGGSPAEAVRPGWGPVALVPAKFLYGLVSDFGKRYSDFAPVAGQTVRLEQGVFGQTAMTEATWKELVPNSLIQRTLEAIQGYSGSPDRSFASAEMMTMQTLQYLNNKAMREWYDKGQQGPPPNIIPTDADGYAKHQEFLSRLRNMTFLNFMGRALVGFFSPVSANVQVENFGLAKEIQNEIKAAGSVPIGMQNFLVKNPDATPYTVAQSIHPQTGDTLPSSLEGENWINANRSFINQFPEAAMWFMPQPKDTKYNPSVYNEQLADGQRAKRAPQQFLDQLYVAAGDQTYYYNLASHESALHAAGTNRSARAAEYARWDAYVAYLQNVMPTWAANSNLFSMQRQVQSQQTIKQLQQIFADGNAPKGAQSDGLKQLIDAYALASEDYTRAATTTNYTTEQSRVRNQWTSYLKQMEQARPELSPVIKSVFSGVFYARY